MKALLFLCMAFSFQAFSVTVKELPKTAGKYQLKPGQSLECPHTARLHVEDKSVRLYGEDPRFYRVYKRINKGTMELDIGVQRSFRRNVSLRGQLLSSAEKHCNTYFIDSCGAWILNHSIRFLGDEIDIYTAQFREEYLPDFSGFPEGLHCVYRKK